MTGTSSAGPPGDDACVLIVDDEDGIRESLAELVEMGGCSAMVAANGAEAMAILAKHHPCLVILDLLMPVMSGIQVLDAMRLDPSLARVPVVISTSAPGRAPVGLPVISKPIDVNAVWDWMRRTCRCTETSVRLV